MKKLIALLLTLLIALSLCACGAAAMKEETYDSAPAAAPYAASEAPAMDMAYSNESSDYGGFAAVEESDTSEAGPDVAEISDINQDKIIYAASADIETTDFDKTISMLNDMVKEYGGFIQSSSVNGANYYHQSMGYDNLRSADYTVRIPSTKFNVLMNSLSELGNIPFSHTYSENVTAQYYDVSARLNACRTQETALLEMMEKAETVSDVITIEDRLTELRYQIESLQSTLNNLDRQVSYSTIDLSISEVREYTPEPEQELGYWQKMLDGFTDNLKGVGDFFKGLLLFLVSALPTLVVLAVVFFALRSLFKNRRRQDAAAGDKGKKTRHSSRRKKKDAASAGDKAEEIIAEVVSEQDN